MDIPTFGALLKFAAELEEEHGDSYGKAAEKADASLKTAFMELSQQNQKTKALVEKLYRDSIRSDMDIGFQEPIPGLNRADYLDEAGKVPNKEENAVADQSNACQDDNFCAKGGGRDEAG